MFDFRPFQCDVNKCKILSFEMVFHNSHIFFSVLVLESVFRFPEVANCKWFALEFREAKTSIKSEKLIFKNDYERVEKKIVNEFAPLT